MSNWNRVRYAFILMIVVSAIALLLLSFFAINHAQIVFDWRFFVPLYFVCWLAAPFLNEAVPITRNWRKNLDNDKRP